MNIHTGAIPTDGIGVETVLCYSSTHILCQLYIPGAGEHILGGPGHSAKIITDRHRAVSDNIVKTCRAVKVIYLRLVNRINCRRTISALVNKLRELGHIDLVKKLIPQWIVIGQTAKVDKVNTVICTEDNVHHLLALIGVKRPEGLKGSLHSCGRSSLELLAANLSLAICIRMCAVAQAVVLHYRPIVSGQVNRIRKSGIGELVFNGIKSLSCCGVGSRIIICLIMHTNHGLSNIMVAIVLLAINHLREVNGNTALKAVALGEDSVKSLVSIACGGNVVITLVKNVAALTAICILIIGCKILEADCNCHSLGCTGSKVLGLIKANKNNRGLLYIALIGRLTVDLNYVLTRSVTNVGDGDRNIDITVGICLGHSKVAPSKLGIGKTVTEGINNCISVVVIANVISAENNVLVASLVVSVSYVDALAVVYIVVIGTCEAEITHILHSRRGEIIVYPGVNKVAGCGDLVSICIKTCKHITETVGTGSARAGEINNCTDVFVVINPTELDCVVAVYQNDNVVKVVVKVGDDLKLCCIRLKIMLARLTAKGSHVTSLVSTLTACTGDDEHSNCVIKGINKCAVRGNNVKRALVNRPVKVGAVVNYACATLVLRSVAALIEIPERLVYHKSCALKTFLKVGGKLK